MKADLASIAAEIESRLKAEESFYEFFKQAWHVFEPGYKYVDNWHVSAVAEHLEAVTNKQIAKLLVNFPPRCLKTDLISVAWPAWEWIKTPNRKFLCGSYSWTLAEDASIKCRQLIKSNWYQTRWGERFDILDDRDKKDHFANDKGGERIITSPDATGTGRGGDRIICLPFDAEVITQEGPQKIGDVVERREATQVLAYDHEAQAPVFAGILDYEVNPNRDMVEIECENGTVLRCTGDHLVYVEGRGYISAESIQPGDEVVGLA